jgi:hypothetical protein
MSILPVAKRGGVLFILMLTCLKVGHAMWIAVAFFLLSLFCWPSRNSATETANAWAPSERRTI